MFNHIVLVNYLFCSITQVKHENEVLKAKLVLSNKQHAKLKLEWLPYKMLMISAMKILWLNSSTDDTHSPFFYFSSVFTKRDNELEGYTCGLYNKTTASQLW